MNGSIAYMSLDGVQYPLVQVEDPSVLLSANGDDMKVIETLSGHVTPTFVSSLGTDVLHIYPWQDTTGIQKLMDNFNAYFRHYMYKSNFNGVWIQKSDKTNLFTVGGTTSGEFNSSHWYWGIYVKDDYAYAIQVQQRSAPDTVSRSCGGDNDFGRLLYSIFVGGVPQTGGGAGSGYIGNSLVSNKKMVGYNVPTSSTESTKTESVNVYSENNQANKPKAGNGFARIKLLRRAFDISDMTQWTPDGDFGWQVTYNSTTKENHITGVTNSYWEYYFIELNVQRNKNYIVSMQFKGSNFQYFARYDTLRILDRFLTAYQIQQNSGINYDYIIAESSTYFGNRTEYGNYSVTFNSGDRDKVWVCIGAGYVYTDASMDMYFKNIVVVESN